MGLFPSKTALFTVHKFSQIVFSYLGLLITYSFLPTPLVWNVCFTSIQASPLSTKLAWIEVKQTFQTSGVAWGLNMSRL